MLSERQQNILDFINQFLDEEGFPPTIREIQKSCDISSTSVVSYNIEALRKKGHLEVKSNKSRGITGPGWWQYRSYQDHAGSTRHKAECIAALSVAAGAGVGDQADETIAADVLETISITGSTANSTSSSGGGTFAVSAAVDQSGTITYKWQRQTATATTRWVDVVGGANGLDTGITYSNFATATLAYAGLASDALDGYKYRCLVNSSKGAKQVITNTATVTFGT